jgi:hypothetical protein
MGHKSPTAACPARAALPHIPYARTPADRSTLSPDGLHANIWLLGAGADRYFQGHLLLYSRLNTTVAVYKSADVTSVCDKPEPHKYSR